MGDSIDGRIDEGSSGLTPRPLLLIGPNAGAVGDEVVAFGIGGVTRGPPGQGAAGSADGRFAAAILADVKYADLVVDRPDGVTQLLKAIH